MPRVYVCPEDTSVYGQAGHQGPRHDMLVPYRGSRNPHHNSHVTGGYHHSMPAGHSHHMNHHGHHNSHHAHNTQHGLNKDHHGYPQDNLHYNGHHHGSHSQHHGIHHHHGHQDHSLKVSNPHTHHHHHNNHHKHHHRNNHLNHHQCNHHNHSTHHQQHHHHQHHHDCFLCHPKQIEWPKADVCIQTDKHPRKCTDVCIQTEKHRNRCTDVCIQTEKHQSRCTDVCIQTEKHQNIRTDSCMQTDKHECCEVDKHPVDCNVCLQLTESLEKYTTVSGEVFTLQPPTKPPTPVTGKIHVKSNGVLKKTYRVEKERGPFLSYVETHSGLNYNK